MKRLWRRKHLWIVLILLAANGLAWLRAGETNLPAVEPRLSPQIAAMRETVIAGQSAGEPFAITLTDQEAAEATAWYLSRYPQIPFSHPQVHFAPDSITGRGLVHMFGLRAPVYGRARVGLRDGTPVVTFLELGVAGVPLPGWMLRAIQSEAEAQFDFTKRNLPLIFTRLESGEGMLTGEGVYR
jgi:hypothetical protein